MLHPRPFQTEHTGFQKEVSGPCHHHQFTSTHSSSLPCFAELQRKGLSGLGLNKGDIVLGQNPEGVYCLMFSHATVAQGLTLQPHRKEGCDLFLVSSLISCNVLPPQALSTNPSHYNVISTGGKKNHGFFIGLGIESRPLSTRRNHSILSYMLSPDNTVRSRFPPRTCTDLGNRTRANGGHQHRLKASRPDHSTLHDPSAWLPSASTHSFCRLKLTHLSQRTHAG